MQVEIFKTNIDNSRNANVVTGLVHLNFPTVSASVDLYDIEHVLRVESEVDQINENELVEFVSNLGFQIQPII